MIDRRADAQRAVIFWADRMRQRLDELEGSNGSTHPLSRVFEAAGGVAPSSTPPIKLSIHQPDEIDRIMEVIGLAWNGIQIRQVLYLWGLGFKRHPPSHWGMYER